MSRELKVYNEFGELILHAEHKQGDPCVRIIDGTQEMSQAIRLLHGRDFERAAFVDGQLCEFRAGWDDPEFLDAVGGFWTANFGWKTRIVQKAPKIARLHGDLEISNVMSPTVPGFEVSPSFFLGGFGCTGAVFAVRSFQFDDLVTNIAYSVNDKFVLASVFENDQARKPELVVLKTAA